MSEFVFKLKISDEFKGDLSRARGVKQSDFVFKLKVSDEFKKDLNIAKRVFNYIVEHEGEIMISNILRDLGITMNDYNKAIDLLKRMEYIE
jgi:predicted DNA-binding transcriptional regulator